MRYRDVERIVEELGEGGGGGDGSDSWRTAMPIAVGLNAVRAAGDWLLTSTGTNIQGLAAASNASCAILLDETVTEARLLAAAFSDDVAAGVQISLRLREVATVRPETNPSLVVSMTDVLCEVELPALVASGMEILAGDPGSILSSTGLHVVEIEVNAPSGWPTNGWVQLQGQLQVR